MEARVIL